jgi:hypothetical protein
MSSCMTYSTFVTELFTLSASASATAPLSPSLLIGNLYSAEQSQRNYAKWL